jgi:hypothetical protein
MAIKKVKLRIPAEVTINTKKGSVLLKCGYVPKIKLPDGRTLVLNFPDVLSAFPAS